MYRAFSTPITCCSIGAATVSATTFELAPGYVQLTCTVGGVISGYCATDRMPTAIPPANGIMTEMTAAKIGLSMKNLATAAQRSCEVRGDLLPAAGVLPGGEGTTGLR